MSTICELRVKKDGKEDEKASEQKFKWDEENRLLAVDENGFASNGYYRARINSRYIGFGLRNPLAAIKIGFGVSKGATDISTNATRFAT